MQCQRIQCENRVRVGPGLPTAQQQLPSTLLVGRPHVGLLLPITLHRCLPHWRMLRLAQSVGPVDAIPEQAEHCRQEREGHGHRDDDHRTKTQRKEDVDRDKHHADQCKDDGQPGEKNGFTGGGTGDLDRLLFVVPHLTLFAVAFGDEERIVNADRDSQHRHHVFDEELQLLRMADQRHDSQRDTDRRSQELGETSGNKGAEDKK